MADLATLQTRLEQAEEALHALRIGDLAAKVRGPDGRSIEYTAGTAGDLRAYIGELKNQIAALLGQTRLTRAPIYGAF